MDEKTKKRVLEYAKDFYGGTFIHYFLSPFDYHRFHTPIAGKVLEITPIDGQVYLMSFQEEVSFMHRMILNLMTQK